MRKVLFILSIAVLSVGAVELAPLESGQWASYEATSGDMELSIVELADSPNLWFQLEVDLPEGKVIVQMAFNDDGVDYMEDSFNGFLSDPESYRENYKSFEENLSEFTEYTEEIRLALINPTTEDSFYLSMSREMFAQFGELGATSISEEQRDRLEESMAGMEWRTGVYYRTAGHRFNCLRMTTDISDAYYSAEVPITGLVYMHTEEFETTPESEMILKDYGLEGATNRAAGLGKPVPFEVFMRELMGGADGQ